MIHIIVEISKYIIILLIAMYTFTCFSIFGYSDPEKKNGMLKNQNVLMFLFHLTTFLVLYLNQLETRILVMYLGQAGVLLAAILLFTRIYPRASRLVVNNMCMLLCIGFVMQTRLDYETAVKQVIFAAVSLGLGLVVPVVIRKLKQLSKFRLIYGIVGIIALGVVAVLAGRSGGAKLGFTIAGFGVQPSELVKILFVFFVASSLTYSQEFKNIVFTTGLAAFHVLILVASKDLGMALIIFIVYLTMLYVATKKPLYLLAGTGAGVVAAVAANKLFTHVQTRVNAWRDPFASYNRGGYQVAQSLFAIGAGGWLGAGLLQGSPQTIPVVSTDFIFSGLVEELGIVFGLCLILICVSVYVMFLNIAMELRNNFYKLVALGLGTCYIFQVFLNVGGVTKFIPSTGVTLPLISYGGSSMVSTVIMFAIIQGLYILREDEEENIERKKKLRRKAGTAEAASRARARRNAQKRAQSPQKGR